MVSGSPHSIKTFLQKLIYVSVLLEDIVIVILFHCSLLGDSPKTERGRLGGLKEKEQDEDSKKKKRGQKETGKSGHA